MNFHYLKIFYGFTEYHWNPDIISHKKDAVRYRNRTFELKVGIMYRPRKRNIDDCNAPRYKRARLLIKLIFKKLW